MIAEGAQSTITGFAFDHMLKVTHRLLAFDHMMKVTHRLLAFDYMLKVTHRLLAFGSYAEGDSSLACL